METVKEKPMKLYAVRDKATGKLVSNITNPSRKYWDREGNCKNAISTAKWSGSDRGRELEMVEFTLVENYDERQIASAQQEWVSVDERLPEYGTCLVVVKYKYDWEDHYNYDVDVAQLCYENDPYRIDGKWITFNDWDEGQDEIHITHWMPLPVAPQPPKGVQ